jgi:phosphoglycolate phosphatase-like HAD superfamily hydrolase
MRTLTFATAVFDVEGTLVDCVPLQLESWRRVLTTAGFNFTHADLQPYSGMDGVWMLQTLLPQEPAEVLQELAAAQGELYTSEFLPRVRPFSAVRDLFEILKSKDILIGIATTCRKDELATYDELIHVLELTDSVACGETVKHGKPDPALLRSCLAQLSGSNASQAVMIGDTPYDAQAAIQSGARAVGLLSGGFSAVDLRKAGCFAVFSEIREVAALWQQPANPAVRSAG